MSKSFSTLFDNFRAGQKTSKIVKKCQKVFRHFSTIFARHLFSGLFCNPLKGKSHQKTKDFHSYQTPEILGKEGEEHSKIKHMEAPCKGKIKRKFAPIKTKERKDRSDRERTVPTVPVSGSDSVPAPQKLERNLARPLSVFHFLGCFVFAPAKVSYHQDFPRNHRAIPARLAPLGPVRRPRRGSSSF